MADYKKDAIAAMTRLSEKLKFRFGALSSPLTVTLSSDASGNPTISIGDGVATHQNAFLRMIVYPSLGLDSIGNAQTAYVPHQLQIATEADASTATSTLLSVANWSIVAFEADKVGAQVQWWLETTGTAPTVSTFSTAANLMSTVQALYDGLVGTW